MSTRQLLTLFFFLAFVLLYCEHKAATFSIKKESIETLLLLSNTLVDLQISNGDDPDFGAIQCPKCNILHTRAAEAVYPFIIAHKHSGEKKYLKAAIRAGNWLIEQQEPSGEWKETPIEWTGTTADQLLMMVCTYPLIYEHLTATERKQWKNSIKKAADFLVRVMSPDFASINYCPTSAAALAITHKIIPDERYVNKAKKLARWTVAKMDKDGFIHGEGGRVFGVEYGVDLGYEMDMSLWGLGLYSRICNDILVNEYVINSLKNKIYFVYPNGAIDGSWGCRGFKWTTFGSKTADGCQILFGLYASEDARYVTAAIKNLEYLRGMIRDGMIGNGPHYWKLFDTTPCNYTTFARAKNLALSVEFGLQKECKTPKLPSDQAGWVKYFPTVDVALVRTKNFMVTISAYGYRDIMNWGKGRYSHHPGGGSICNLWVEGHGFLQTSSWTKYVRGEPMHMPVVNDTVICLTPRIEFKNDDGYFTNLYECEGQFSINSENQTTAIISTAGELKNEKYLPGGVAYIWTHYLFDNVIEKSVELRYHDRKLEVRIVEPIVQEPGMRFSLTDLKTVLIQGGKRNFKFEIIEGDGQIELGKNESHYWFPFPSLKCYPIVINVAPCENFTQEIKYRISIVR